MILVWNEFRHEKSNEAVRRIYPDGIHAVLAEGLRGAGFDEVETATLDDPDTLVAEMAAWACGEHEQVPEAAFTRLVELATDHREPLVREACIAALGAIGDERARDAILAGTRDKPAIRRRAVIALVAFDGPDVDEALRRALDDKDWQVREAADELLREI